MMKLRNFHDDLKSMFSSSQTPSSQKPSLDPRRVWIAVLFISLTLATGALFGFLSNGGTGNSDDEGHPQDEAAQAGQNAAQEGSLVIHFKDGHGNAGTKGAYVRASSGTLVRVRLLNSLETFDTVPTFVQVVDYALGQSFYGWTLVGDASGDSNVDRIKMSFHHARSPRGNASLEISAQALSLDGTLGVKAQKVEGMSQRALTGAGKSVGGGLAGAVQGSGDLSSLLLRALLTGLQNEISSDLGSAYNRGAALSLKPGEEFFVQLTENF